MSEQDKITLREAYLHSQLCEKISIYGKIDVYVRPWTPLVIQEAIPCIKAIIMEFKTLQSFQKNDNLFESVMGIIQKSEKLLQDIQHLVFLTLQVSNKDLPFSEEDAQQFLIAEYYIKIMKIIWDQNVSKNLFPGLEKLGLKSSENKMNQTMTTTPTPMG